MKLRTAAAMLVLLAMAGCGMHLGSSGPLEYRTLAMDVPAGTPASAVVGTVRQTAADLVLLASASDSAWFATVARGSSLQLSGPTKGQAPMLGFLAMKPVGDTTVTLAVAGGRPVVLHDALYQPGKHRYLDLMLARIDTAGPAPAVARALLTYVAANVMQDAGVILGLLAPNPALTDSVSRLIRPAFLDLAHCAGGEKTPPADTAAARVAAQQAAAASPIRVLYGPETRIRCDQGRLVGGPGTPVFLHFSLGAQP